MNYSQTAYLGKKKKGLNVSHSKLDQEDWQFLWLNKSISSFKKKQIINKHCYPTERLVLKYKSMSLHGT